MISASSVEFLLLNRPKRAACPSAAFPSVVSETCRTAFGPLIPIGEWLGRVDSGLAGFGTQSTQS